MLEDDKIEALESKIRDVYDPWSDTPARIAEHLVSAGYALSTPPADDIREALYEVRYNATHFDSKMSEDGFDRAISVIRSRGTVTPPADDIREALARTISNSVMEDFANSRREADAEGRQVARDILARFEVRPRGTVTDAEVERALDALAEEYVILTFEQMRAALEAARNT